MEKTTIIYSFESENVEAHKRMLQKQLTDYVSIEGRHLGMREMIITDQEFRVLAKNAIESKTALTVDVIHRALAAEGLYFDAKEAEAIGEKRKQELQRAIKANSHKQNELTGEKDLLPCQAKGYAIQKWLVAIALLLAGVDFFTSLGIFQVAYPMHLAIVMSLGVAAVVFASHFFALWARRGATSTRQRKRSIYILGAALVFFAGISVLRMQSVNSDLNISVDNSDVTQTPSEVSFLPFVLISFLLFAVTYFLTLFFSKTEREKLIDEEHAVVDKKIADLNVKQTALKKELKEIPEKISTLKNNARYVFYYLQRSIKECKSIANAALMLFKQVYVQSRGAVPDFFTSYDSIEIDDAIIIHQKNSHQ